MPLFLHQLRGELRKLFARRRTWIGFGAFVALQIVLLVIIQTTGFERLYRRLIENQGEVFDYYFSGLTLGFIIVRLSVFLLGGLYLALVGGDIVSKEAEDGVLRMALVRPVSRFRVLLLKYATCFLYTVALVWFLGIASWMLGIATRGWGGGFFAFAPERGLLAFFDYGQGIARYTGALTLLGFNLFTVTSLAFFLSCLRIKPAAATIVTLSYLFVDLILQQAGFMEDHEHLLLVHHMGSWVYLCQDIIPWADIIRHTAVLTGINLTLFTAGWVVFQSRDFKS